MAFRAGRALRSTRGRFHSSVSNAVCNPEIQRAAAALQNADYVIIAAGPGLDVADVNRGSSELLPDVRRVGECNSPAAKQWWLKHYPYLAKDSIFPTCETNFFPDPKLFQKQPHVAWGFWGQLIRSSLSTESSTQQSHSHMGYIPNHVLRQHNIWAYQILWKWVTQAKNWASPEEFYAGNAQHVNLDHHSDQRLSMKNLKSWSIFTSNVDGQFQKYGFDNARIMEPYGNFHYLQCSKRCSEDLWPISPPADGKSEGDWERSNPFLQDVDSIHVPRCRNCGSIARPAVNMGNSGLNEGVRHIFGQSNESNGGDHDEILEDHAWVSSRIESQLEHFSEDLQKVIGTDTETSRKTDVVILEIGGGKNCGTVTKFCDTMLRSNRDSIDTTLIRINCIADGEVQRIEPCQQTISLNHPGVFEPLLQIDRAMSLMDASTENLRELEEWLNTRKSEHQGKQYLQM